MLLFLELVHGKWKDLKVRTLSRVIKVYQEINKNSHVMPCNAMYSHVMSRIAMYYHVYPCITMYSHV